MADLDDPRGLLREAHAGLEPVTAMDTLPLAELRIARANALALVAIGITLQRIAETLELLEAQS